MKFYKKAALLAVPLFAITAPYVANLAPAYAIEKAETEVQESHPAAFKQFKGMVKSHQEEQKRFIIDHGSGVSVYYNDETVFVKDKKIVTDKELKFDKELVVIADHCACKGEAILEEDESSPYAKTSCQVVARIIMVEGENEDEAVYVDHFHLTHGENPSIQADHIGLSIRVDKETKYDIKDYKGNDLDLGIEDLDGKTVAVLYTVGPNTYLIKDTIMPLSFKFIVLDQTLSRAELVRPLLDEPETLSRADLTRPWVEASNIKVNIPITTPTTLPATIDMLELPVGIQPLPAVVAPVPITTLPATAGMFTPIDNKPHSFLELLPVWAGGKLTAEQFELLKANPGIAAEFLHDVSGKYLRKF